MVSVTCRGKKKSKQRRGKDDDEDYHRDDDDDESGTHSIRSASDAGFDPTRPIASFETMENHEKKLLRGIKKSILDAEYELMLDALQTELVVWQDYVKANGMKVVVIFEGRDAAGKGGCISRITEVLSARICKVVALAAPTEEERTQWYFQRYVQHLPSAGNIVIFDRSWYNRSGVERVMGFATEEQVKQFEKDVNIFERMLVESGVKILKLWFDVSDAEQESRFLGRIQHSEKRWKLSPMDLYARSKWYDYAKARDAMFENTSDTVPWSVVPADDKRVARLNAIQHILSCIDYKEVPKEPLSLPPRQEKPSDYTEPDLARFQKVFVVPQVYTSEDLAVRNMDGRKWEDIARDVAKKAKKQLSVSMDESMDDSWPK